MGVVQRIVADIAGGVRSAVEVIDSYIGRAEAANAQVNALVTETFSAARETARRLDHEAPDDRPLLGVPFTVKDTILTEGVRTTAGSLLLSDNMPTVDAPVVRRLKDAGAIMIGKANCPEFAMDIHTANRMFGATLNPLDRTRTSGGSSGGDSAAVVAGFAAFGIGSDYGGSIRWPAHCTGSVGIRPTAGLVWSAGLLPNASQHELKPPNSLSARGRLHTIAPIASSVDDLRPVLSVMAGNAVVQELDKPRPDHDMSGIRIAFFEGDGNVAVRADLVEQVRVLAQALADHGAIVEHRAPPRIEEAARLLGELRRLDGLADVEDLAGDRRDLLAETTLLRLSESYEASVAELQTAAARSDALRADALAFMDEWPFWILPVATIPAFELDPDNPTHIHPTFDVEGRSQTRQDVMAPSWAISTLGFPSIAVPCGRSNEGLPIGAQLVGPPFSERALFDIASTVEKLVGA